MSSVFYPVCGDWECDDSEDWEMVNPGDEEHAAVMREYRIVHYHQPRPEWRDRLRRERDERNAGWALWMESLRP